MKMGRCSVPGCNHNSGCSLQVITSFLTCSEMSRPRQLLHWRSNRSHTILQVTAEKILLFRIMCSRSWILDLFTLPLIWNVASSENISFSWNCLPPFSTVFSCKTQCLFIFADTVSTWNNCSLFNLQHNYLYNTFHTIIFLHHHFPAYVSHWLTGLYWNTWHTLSRHIRLTSTILFIQVSSFYKLLVLFLCGRFLLNLAQKSLCTVITDFYTS